MYVHILIFNLDYLSTLKLYIPSIIRALSWDHEEELLMLNLAWLQVMSWWDYGYQITAMANRTGNLL